MKDSGCAERAGAERMLLFYINHVSPELLRLSEANFRSTDFSSEDLNEEKR